MARHPVREWPPRGRPRRGRARSPRPDGRAPRRASASPCREPGADRRSAAPARAAGRPADRGVRVGTSAAHGPPARARPRRAGRPRRRRRLEGLGHRPREDDRHVRAPARDRRDERGELADGAALVAPRRVARADEDRLDVAVEQQPGIASGSGRLDAGPAGPPAAAAGVATSPARVRSEPATTASAPGRALVRTRAAAGRGRPDDAEAAAAAGRRRSCVDEEVDGRIEVGAGRDRQRCR